MDLGNKFFKDDFKEPNRVKVHQIVSSRMRIEQTPCIPSPTVTSRFPPSGTTLVEE